MTPPRQADAYPPRFYSLRRRSWGCLSIPLLLLFGFATINLVNIYSGQTWWLQLIGLGIAVFLNCYMIRDQVNGWERARIYPIFEQRVPADTYFYGQAMLRNLLYLDKIARHRRVKELSAFGFPDPLHGENVNWHDAAHGLETINALIEGVTQSPGVVNDAEFVLLDLKRVQNALNAAQRRDVRFSFLIEDMGGTSGPVWEKRKAYF